MYVTCGLAGSGIEDARSTASLPRSRVESDGARGVGCIAAASAGEVWDVEVEMESARARTGCTPDPVYRLYVYLIYLYAIYGVWSCADRRARCGLRAAGPAEGRACGGTDPINPSSRHHALFLILILLCSLSALIYAHSTPC